MRDNRSAVSSEREKEIGRVEAIVDARRKTYHANFPHTASPYLFLVSSVPCHVVPTHRWHFCSVITRRGVSERVRWETHTYGICCRSTIILSSDPCIKNSVRSETIYVPYETLQLEIQSEYSVMRKTRSSIFRDIYYQPYDDCTRLKLYSSSKGDSVWFNTYIRGGGSVWYSSMEHTRCLFFILSLKIMYQFLFIFSLLW